MPAFEKHFTIEEARRELPWLKQTFSRVQELVRTLEGRRMAAAQIDRLVRGNGHGSGHPESGKEIGELQQLLASVTEKGIEVKDPSQGLVDFPHWRGEEEVFLCWRYGEEDIRFWHTIKGGFAGRMPL